MDDPPEMPRERLERRDGCRRLPEYRGHRRDRSIAGEWTLPAHRLVKQDAQGKDVRSAVELLALGLLRREAKVEDFEVTGLVDHHVVGLEVTVDNAPFVGGVHGIGQGNADLEELVERHAVRRDDVAEGLPISIVRKCVPSSSSIEWIVTM